MTRQWSLGQQWITSAEESAVAVSPTSLQHSLYLQLTHTTDCIDLGFVKTACVSQHYSSSGWVTKSLQGESLEIAKAWFVLQAGCPSRRLTNSVRELNRVTCIKHKIQQLSVMSAFVNQSIYPVTMGFQSPCTYTWVYVPWVSTNLQSKRSPWKNICGLRLQDYHRPDVLPDTQATLSKHQLHCSTTDPSATL